MTDLEQQMFALLKRAISEMHYARWDRPGMGIGRNALYKDIKTLMTGQYTPEDDPVIKQENTILEVLATGECSKAGIVAKSGMTKYMVEKTMARLLADDRVKHYKYVDQISKATRWGYALAKEIK